jgi:hypothetical protein
LVRAERPGPVARPWVAPNESSRPCALGACIRAIRCGGRSSAASGVHLLGKPLFEVSRFSRCRGSRWPRPRRREHRAPGRVRRMRSSSRTAVQHGAAAVAASIPPSTRCSLGGNRRVSPGPHRRRAAQLSANRSAAGGTRLMPPSNAWRDASWPARSRAGRS